MKVEKHSRVRSVITELDGYGLENGGREETSSEYTASYEYRGGVARLEYTEQTEGGKVSTTVIARADHVIVERRGAVSSHFDFREGVTDRSLYTVSPYSFDAEITPKRVEVSLDENGGRIDLRYRMNIGGAEKSVRMSIWIS